jgi:SAM-dependent methyltransferase
MHLNGLPVNRLARAVLDSDTTHRCRLCEAPLLVLLVCDVLPQHCDIIVMAVPCVGAPVSPNHTVLTQRHEIWMSPVSEALMTDDVRRYAPATVRNRGPIIEVLKRHLPSQGIVLEIASGSGEHITHFAAGLAGGTLQFQPSDPDASARASIDAWVRELGVSNIRPALAIDAAADSWPVAKADAVLCINMIHISPWAATVGLMRGAARILPPGGLLYLYGPYRRGGQMVPSNQSFDESLRAQNPAWGIRDLEVVVALAAEHGFAAPVIEEMPANNLSVMFRR